MRKSKSHERSNVCNAFFPLQLRSECPRHIRTPSFSSILDVGHRQVPVGSSATRTPPNMANGMATLLSGTVVLVSGNYLRGCFLVRLPLVLAVRGKNANLFACLDLSHQPHPRASAHIPLQQPRSLDREHESRALDRHAIHVDPDTAHLVAQLSPNPCRDASRW